MQIWGIFVDQRLLYFARQCNSWRWLRKWWMVGMMSEMCVSLPIVDSNSFAVTFLSIIILFMSFVHAVNLFGGREIVRRQKSHLHPRIIFDSSNSPLAMSLWRAAIS
jgi:hypothetical protein